MKSIPLLTILLLLFATSLKAKEPYTDDEQLLMQRYYELFSQPDKQKEFYQLNQQVRAIMEKRSGREGYYVFRINEVTYEVNMGRNSKALKLAKKVLEEMKEQGDSHFDMIYSTMSVIYEDRGNYKMSRYYSDKAIKAVSPKDTIGLIGAYLAAANLESSNHPDEAIRLVDYILPYCKKYPSHYNYAQTMKALAYYFKNDSPSFFQILDEYNILKRENNLQDKQNDSIMQTIKEVFNGNYDEALRLINKRDLYSNNMGYFDMLIQLYKLKGDKDMVIHEQQRKLEAIDSLNANLIYQNMNEMNAEMEVKKAQQEVIKSRMYWLAAVVVLLIIVTGLLIWRYLTRRAYQKRLLKKNQELEIALNHAKESDRMKTSFIEHVSHEIRTPLNVITGFAQIITNPDYELDEKERNHMINDISKNTTEITQIINELLEIADNESKEYYERNDMVDVNQFCQDIMDKMELDNDRLLSMKFVSLVDKGFTLRTNRLALDKILTQLVNNALKFTKDGSVELRVRERAAHGGVEFTITDTGIGINKEHKDKIFDRFYKVDNFKQGFGLGLTISQKLATLLGGQLELDEHYTKGARFVLTLPEQ